MDPLNDVFLRKFEVVLSRKKYVGQFILGLAKTFGFTVLEGPKLVVKLCSHVIVS